MNIDPRERLVDVYSEIRETAGDAADALLAEHGANWTAEILKSDNFKLIDLLQEAYHLLKELGLE